jgi:hypothetical protein
MKLEDRVFQVEAWVIERQRLLIELRNIQCSLSCVFESAALKIQTDAHAETGQYLSDNLASMQARAVLRQGQEVETLSAEYDRLEMEITTLEAKLEHERSLITYTLYGSAGETTGEGIETIQ